MIGILNIDLVDSLIWNCKCPFFKFSINLLAFTNYDIIY